MSGVIDRAPGASRAGSTWLAGYAFLCVAGAIAPWFSDFLWFCELPVHFPMQLAAAAGAGLLAAAWRRSWALALVLAIAAAIPLSRLAPQLLPLAAAQAAHASGPSLRVAAVNLNRGNRDWLRVIAELRRQRLDVIGFSEYTPSAEAGLAALGEEFPHSLREPRADAFGVALYSRLPLTDAGRITLAPEPVPALRADVETGLGPVRVYAVHLRPPVSASYARARIAQSRGLAADAAAAPHPVVLLGDFNDTPFSRSFRALLRDGGLRVAADGHGLMATWPAGLPILGVPIDHCLHSPELEVRRVWRGGDIGSDHLPLLAELAFGEGVATARAGGSVLQQEAP